MKRQLIFLLAAFLPFFNSCREKADVPVPDLQEWQQYNTSNSLLPDNQVNAIVIDNNTTKWIGTSRGLAKIDSGAVSVFTPGNSPLPSGYIRALATGLGDTLWIGTDQGLVYFTGREWRLYTPENSPLPDKSITSLAFHAPSGTLWIGTDSGLARIRNRLVEAIEGVYHPVLSLATDAQGTLWIGTFNSLAFRGQVKSYKDHRWTTFQLDEMGYPSAFPYGLATGPDHTVYVVLSGTSVKSVLRYKDRWEEMPCPENTFGPRTVALEGNTLWVGGKYLSRLNGPDPRNFALPAPASHVLSLAIDRHGEKWIGTLSGGVFVRK